MASICVAQGDLEGAFSLYDSALRTNPARKPTIEYTLILRGANWEVAGNPVRALNAYALGVRLFPESARFRMCQAVALKKTGDFDGAAKIFRASLASDPASAATYCAGLDYLLVEQDNKPARVAAWRDLVHSYPDMPWPYCYLGKALEASQDFDGAIDAYRRAIQLDPKNVQCVETLANAFRAKGDNPGAIVAIREALQQVPDTPPLRILLIRTLLAAGDIEAARAEAAAGRQSGIEIPPDLLPKLDPNAQ
jgi:tetratricopeptide (TPR) repeat protein